MAGRGGRVSRCVGGRFIDPTAWVCPSIPSPAVIGDVLVFRDHGHLTSVFVSTLGGRLSAAIAAGLGRSLGATTFS